MKVFNYRGGFNTLYVAAPTQKRALELFGISRTELKNFGGTDVGSKRLRWLALRSPETVYVEKDNHVVRAHSNVGAVTSRDWVKKQACAFNHHTLAKEAARRTRARRVEWGLQVSGADWVGLSEAGLAATPAGRPGAFYEGFETEWRSIWTRMGNYHPQHTVKDEILELYKAAYRELAHSINAGYSHIEERARTMGEAAAAKAAAKALEDFADFGLEPERVRVPNKP